MYVQSIHLGGWPGELKVEPARFLARKQVTQRKSPDQLPAVFFAWVLAWVCTLVVAVVCVFVSWLLLFVVVCYVATLDRWRAQRLQGARHRQGRNTEPLGGGYPRGSAPKRGTKVPRDARGGTLERSAHPPRASHHSAIAARAREDEYPERRGYRGCEGSYRSAHVADRARAEGSGYRRAGCVWEGMGDGRRMMLRLATFGAPMGLAKRGRAAGVYTPHGVGGIRRG